MCGSDRVIFLIDKVAVLTMVVMMVHGVVVSWFLIMDGRFGFLLGKK